MCVHWVTSSLAGWCSLFLYSSFHCVFGLVFVVVLAFQCKYQGSSFITVLVSGASIKVSHSSLSLCWLFSASIKAAHSLLCLFQVQTSMYLITVTCF